MFDALVSFRRRLAAGETLIGSGVTLADPLVSEALSDSVDYLWIDLEHMALSPESLRAHLLAARSKSTPALVRVAGGGSAAVKPVLDAGAHGIVVPQVRSVDEVRQLVSDCRYPPVGTRGMGAHIPTNYGRSGGPPYVERANANILACVMIETAEALEAIDGIVAVPGLDVLIIGPWDLSGALGVLGDVEHPRVVAAMEKVVAKARGAGLFVGSGMPVDPEFACAQARRGVQMLQIGGDCAYLVSCAEQISSTVRGGLEP